MKHKRWLSILLALTILLGCIGWTPTTALPLSSPTNNASTMAPDGPATTQPNTVPPEVGGRGGKTGHLCRLRDEEKDDLNKFVYLNEDGSKTMYLYDHPVKYQDENGEIQDISLDIADTGDKNYPFRTKANSAVTTFPAALSDGITLSGNGVELRLAAQMPSGNTALNHQARRLDDQTVAYTYDDKTTIEYALTYTGFKEDIVVSEYTGQTEYHFVLHTNGLILTNLGGAYYLTDDDGQIKATIGDVIVFTADERNNTFGRLEVATIKENQVYAVTIVLDADYLADPNTKYPIRIDPTVSLTYSADGANAIEDVTIQSENVSYPENASVSVGLRSYGISRLLMKFNLDFSDYEGVTVTSATVSVRDLMCESTEMTVYCYPFTGTAWTESSASWSSLTQSWGSLQDSQIISYDNGLTMDTAHYYPFDISNIVQQWIDGDADPEKGVIFKASSTVETATTLESRIFGSFERESYQPIFEMTYQCGITLSQTSASMYMGDTLTLTAVTAPAGQAVTWASTVSSVATVANGVVTAVNSGQTTITATLDDGTCASCTVTVYARKISLNYASVDVDENSAITLTATTIPADETVTWESSNPSIASVAGGRVIGIQAGVVTITATLGNGTSACCTVYVTIADGVYYIRNASSGNCLETTEDRTYIYEQKVDETKRIDQLWKITYISNGNYVIRPLRDFSVVMTVDAFGYVAVADAALDDANVAYGSLWKISRNAFGYAFKLGGSDSSTAKPVAAGTLGSLVYSGTWDSSLACHWELEQIDGIFLRDTTTLRTVSASTEITIDIGRSYSLADLGLDYEYYGGLQGGITWTSSDSAIVSVDTSGKVSATAGGTAVITLRATLDGVSYSQSYVLYVCDNYINELTTAFNFTFEDAVLIGSVYDRVAAAFPNDTDMMKAWRTARVQGAIVYNSGTWGPLKWDDVAGIPYECSESVFFVDILGFTQEEYEQLSTAIWSNHRSAYADFAHMQITLAARLAYQLHKTGMLSNVYTISSDENVSYLAGWLGDATITNSGTTSFGNDDYHADLDAENVYQLILVGYSYSSAFNHYYDSLSSKTRAQYFLTYIDYATVVEKIYYELIDKDLYAKMAEAAANDDDATYSYYLQLLHDEQYHIATIMSLYPDTYDFMCSIRDGLPDIADY